MDVENEDFASEQNEIYRKMLLDHCIKVWFCCVR